MSMKSIVQKDCYLTVMEGGGDEGRIYLFHGHKCGGKRDLTLANRMHQPGEC